MKKSIYCVFDKVGNEMSTTLMLANNKQFFIRDMSTCKLPPVMEEHTEDFDIYCLGTIETETLEVVPEKTFVAHLGAVRRVDYGNNQEANILDSKN